MRYLAGFVGGLIVGLLLFFLQKHLIGVDPDVRPEPTPEITLKRVSVSQPLEDKPYTPDEPPPPPETAVRPADPVDINVNTEVPRPTFDTVSGEKPGIFVPGDGKPTDYSDRNRVGALDGTAVIIIAVAPQYPVQATRNNVEGFVELEFTILPDGTVDEVEIIRADPPGVFEQSARQAILRWKFQPRMVDGRPVPMRARQLFEFGLKQE